MSVLLFYVAENRYVIENQYILKVIPYVSLRQIPFSNTYIAGVLNLGGRSVPVLDFCQLIEQRQASEALHTRIILIKDPNSFETTGRIIGIIGENVTEILDLSRSYFVQSDFNLYPYPFLNGLYSDKSGVIQRVNIEELFKFLTEEIVKITKDQHV